MTYGNNESLDQFLERLDPKNADAAYGQLRLEAFAYITTMRDRLNSEVLHRDSLASTLIEVQREHLATNDALAAAELLVEVTEACLRMMDDVIKGTGKGDMAINPEHSLTVVDGWKRLAKFKTEFAKIGGAA